MLIRGFDMSAVQGNLCTFVIPDKLRYHGKKAGKRIVKKESKKTKVIMHSENIPIRLFFLFQGILLAICTYGQKNVMNESQTLSVWTVSETRRILRSELPEENKTLTLKAARNEWEDFQIFIRSDKSVDQISIETDDLHGPQGDVITSEKTYVYRQHQFYLSSPSFRNYSFQPGWYPDALIPFKHPLTRTFLNQDDLKAVPFDLPAGETHGFTLDLYVPPNVVSGIYEGTYQIKSNYEIMAEIQVTLEVWDFDLPEIPALITEFGAPQHFMRHLARVTNHDSLNNEDFWDRVAAQCNEMVCRHLINPYPKDYHLSISLEEDGSFTASREDEGVRWLNNFIDSYPLNALRIPLRGCPTIKQVAMGNSFFQEDTFQTSDFTETGRFRLRNYMKSWDEALDLLNNTVHITYFVYLCDEPNTKNAYNFVQTLGRTICDLELKNIEVLVVENMITDSPLWGNLYGAVDIWCPLFCDIDADSIRSRIFLEEKVWTYTALTQCDNSLYWETDFPLIHYRIPAWLAWKDNISGILYWRMNNWRYDGDIEPWTRPRTHTSTWQGYEYHYNGEGCLVYPADTLGFTGIVPSLRLKALRDSFEDYQYLSLLEKAGGRQAVLSIIDTLVTSWTDFSTSPSGYEQAREKLAEMILKQSSIEGTQLNNSVIIKQNFPNPFNHSTEIQFCIQKNDHVTLKVYDVRGRKVVTLVDQKMKAGTHTISFNGTGLASGVYFYKIYSGDFVYTKKCLLIK
ncbi:MAG: DUF4091 domain-containing protein [bacterium]